MPIIDTSVYVATLNRSEVNHQVCVQWMKKVKNDGVQLYAPNIILAEVAAAISRGQNDLEAAKSAIKHLESIILMELVPVSPELAADAAQIAAEQRIRGCDAVFVALAKQRDDILITLDRQQMERSQDIIQVSEPFVEADS